MSKKFLTQRDIKYVIIEPSIDRHEKEEKVQLTLIQNLDELKLELKHYILNNNFLLDVNYA